MWPTGENTMQDKFDEKFTYEVPTTETVRSWREREAFGRKVGSALLPLVVGVEVQVIRKIGNTISTAFEHNAICRRIEELESVIEQVNEFNNWGRDDSVAEHAESDNRVDKMNELTIEVRDLESERFSAYVEMLDSAKGHLPEVLSAIDELSKLKLNIEIALGELNRVFGVISNRSAK